MTLDLFTIETAARTSVADPMQLPTMFLMVELSRQPHTYEQLRAVRWLDHATLDAQLAALEPEWVTREGPAYTLTPAGQARAGAWAREIPKPPRPQL